MKKHLIMTVFLLVFLILSIAMLSACNDGEFVVTVYDTDGVTVIETFEIKDGASLSEKDLTFIKEGYTFGGVFTDKEFKNKYEPSAVTSSTSLYAKFTKDKYYISFLNDGSETFERLEVGYGDSFVLPSPVARTGYNFNGWTLDGEEFDDDSAYAYYQSIRLRANWSAKTTDVTFDANDGEFITVGPSKFTYASAIVLPAVQRTGYSLIGWAKNDATTAYSFGSTWTEEDPSITFKAIWSAKSTKVTFSENGGEFAAPPQQDDNLNYYMNVAFDSQYTLPTVTKAGYTYKWVLSGTSNEVAASGTWDYTATTIRLVAQWTANPYRINLDAGDGSCDATFISTTYGSAIGYLPSASAPVGYVFDGWYYMKNGTETHLTANTVHSTAADINAYAKYVTDTNVLYKIEVYLENANDENYMKIDTLEKHDETGKTVDATTQYAVESYMTYNADASTASGAVAADGSLVLKLYFDRKEYTITINENSENTVPDIVAKYGAAITMPTVTRTGYTFDQWDVTYLIMPPNNATITALWVANDYRLYLDVTLGSSYLATDGVMFDAGRPYIEVAFDSENYSIPVVNSVDYTFVSWKNASDDTTFSTAKWNVTQNQTVYATWMLEGQEFIKDSANKYFKEYNGSEYVYVFVNGTVPSFGTATLAVTNGTSVATIVSGNLVCNSLGEFTLAITQNDRTRSVKAEFVDHVGLFQRGPDYVSNWLNRKASNYLNPSDETYSLMQVGTANGFKPDMVIDNGKTTIDCDAANIIFKVFEGANEITEGFTFSNGELYLGSTLKNKALTITISPKYYFDGTAPTATFQILVNDGYNVYDSNSFKLAYENNTMKTINILRNFKIVLTEDKYALNNGTRYVINDFDHCAYIRYASENETVTINCNYFTIDGSELDYFDNRYDGRGFLGAAANINNVQAAIFGYSGKAKLSNSFYPDTKLIINDMYLQGNNTKESDYVEAQYNGLDIYKMSGSFNGVRIENCGNLELDNCTIKNTLIAVYGSPYSGQSVYYNGAYVTAIEIDLSYVLLDNSWANSVYCYGNSELSLNSCRLLTSSGAAVHFEDHFDPNYTGVNTINIDAATEISNYVTGEEAWFVAYGMNAMIPQLKTSLQEAAQLITNTASGGSITKGIIKDIDGSEYFNFSVFTRSAGGESSDWATDLQGTAKLDILYEQVKLVPQTIAEGTKATITSDLKYIDFELAVPNVGQAVFFVTLE